MSRCIVTYAAGAHEELLDISFPTYCKFGEAHGYKMIIGSKMTDRPAPWNKIPLLLYALKHYDTVVWFDCDLIVVDPKTDLPPLKDSSHSLVRHFEDNSEVPNSGVWQLSKACIPLLEKMWELDV